jgi:hypothetical protein
MATFGVINNPGFAPHEDQPFTVDPADKFVRLMADRMLACVPDNVRFAVNTVQRIFFQEFDDVCIDRLEPDRYFERIHAAW